MKTRGNTVLITGGATGIGFALAESFVRLDNEVIICGRRENKLKEAKERIPKVHVRKCDISKDDERKQLCEWVCSNFKEINMLVNNAGIQRSIDFRKGAEDLLNNEDEIEINLKAQIYLSAYFIPTLSKQKEAAIINISSGLGFAPLARYPVYSATKAALHSFSMSLRHQLKETSIKVFEVIPSTVKDTELKDTTDHKITWTRGISSAEVVDTTIKALENDKYEVAVGDEANGLISGSRSNPEETFRNMNH